MNAPEQVVDRSTFIGGSDAAAILGVSPWKTRLDVYLQKRGEQDEAAREDDPDLQDLLETGKDMEPVIVNRLIRRYGVKVTKRSMPERPNRYVDKEHSFLAAEIDFEWELTPKIAARFNLPQRLIGTIQNGEAKKVQYFASAQFGEAESEEVPIQYAAQAEHGLGVTGRELTLFAVQIGDSLLVYWVLRDDALIAAMRQKLVHFWHHHVQGGIPPEPANLPDIYKLFKRVEAIKIEASDGAVALLMAFNDAKDQKRVADEAIESAKFELGKFMLGEAAIIRPVGPRGGKKSVEPTEFAQPIAHELRINGMPALVINLQQQRRIDTDKVKSEHPEIAESCSYDLRFFKYGNPPKSKPAKRQRR